MAKDRAWEVGKKMSSVTSGFLLPEVGRSELVNDLSSVLSASIGAVRHPSGNTLSVLGM